MPDPMKLKKLIDLRRAADKSQTEAATYFGLAPSARNEIRLWEYGQKIPPFKYRTPFIGYLWDFLNLRENPQHFEDVWSILVEQWDWDPLNEVERQRYMSDQGGNVAPASSVEVGSRVLHDIDSTRPDTNESPPESRVDTDSSGLPRGRLIRSALVLASIAFLGLLVIIGFMSGIRYFTVPSTPTVTPSPTATVTPTHTPTPTLTFTPTLTPTALIFIPGPEPTKHYAAVGLQCPTFEYLIGKEKTVLKLCAWVNLDYDNHRVRGYGRAQWEAGPKTEAVTATLRFKADDQMALMNQRHSTGDLIDVATDLLNCGGWEIVISEMEVVVTYADGQQEVIMVSSARIKPGC